MKLGANSVLFGGFDMATAFKCLAMAGYDDVLSIEHEDAAMSPTEGLRRSVEFLQTMIIREAA